MRRRDCLRVLGGASLGALGRRLHARARGGGWRTFNPPQRELVATIAELILPQTETPGARAARVDAFIDLALAEWYDDADRERFLAGLADVDARARRLYGTEFLRTPAAQQVGILVALDQELAREREAEQAAAPRRSFFHMMKRLTLVGFYTSEVGATQELRQAIIPGRYDPCTLLETGGS